jgi:hypothetical protein
MQFVPENAREEQTPCIHIPLSPGGKTLEVLYRTGTQQEVEEALGAWLRATLQATESTLHFRRESAPYRSWARFLSLGSCRDLFEDPRRAPLTLF